MKQITFDTKCNSWQNFVFNKTIINRREFLQLFLCGLGFLPHVSGKSGIGIRNFLDPLSRVEMFEYVSDPELCGR